MGNKFKWYVTATLLMSYGSIELTNHIYNYITQYDSSFLWTGVVEAVLMWIAWLGGCWILAWQFNKEEKK